MSGTGAGGRRGQKLELTWVGKEERPRLEPRILVQDPTLSYAASNRSEGDLFDNRLIQGDNLLALKALEAEFTGKVKCVFIDPPYNTGSAFEHYDDGLEHSLWLTMMRDRLELIHRLLSETGSAWVTLDDNEVHYFKVMADEVFGRKNFIADITWQKKHAPGNNEKGISSDSDHLLVWAKKSLSWKWNLLPRSSKQNDLYKNLDDDPRGFWQPDNLTRSEHRERDFYPIRTPSGRDVYPPQGRSWSRPPAEIERLRLDGRLWFGPKGDAGPRLKRFLSEVQDGVVARTVWLRDDVGSNDEAKKEAKAFEFGELFSTPKPERLLRQALQIATDPGDVVLDSFAGSGTTGAVAHKMGRRWIMVELGDHARTHIVPRLKKVIDGDDKGGVTEATGWQGGGGFRFYRLAPSLLKKDRWGNWIISKEYNPAMLAEAMCKHMSFTYAPSQDPMEYWQHGHSSERDFIFVTTHALTHKMLEAISYDVEPDRHLLICCKAFSTARPDAFANLTLTKIPHAILSTCEWGRDDYSLRVAGLPEAAPQPRVDEADDVSERKVARRKRIGSGGPTLFDAPADAEG